MGLQVFHIVIFLFFTCFSISNSHAEVRVKVSEEERVVFAFFKKAGRLPEFNRWANTIEYHLDVVTKQDRQERKIFYEQQRLRLQWGFGTYDETKQFLPIRTPATLSLVHDGEKKQLNYTLDNYVDQEFMFFPYEYTDQIIGIVIPELHAKGTIELDDQQFEEVSGNFDGQDVLHASMRILVRPLEAELKKPFIVDNRNVWPLVGDIASFSFDKKGNDLDYQKFLYYTAPWYLTSDEERLRNLLEGD